MQRVSALLPSWDRRSRSNSTSSAKVPAALDKVLDGPKRLPLSIASTRLPLHPRGSAVRRTGRRRSTVNATRQLEFSSRSASTSTGAVDSRSSAAYVTQKIPPRIIQNAVGLAVFSCMRSGLWMSGSGGAGLITARKADGTWSPPSGIILHTAALGFVIGVDIYDCVLVINSVQTLELFTRPRLTLGINVSLTVGPLAPVGSLDQDARWNGLDDTVLTYVKARGKHQAVELGGSLVTERGNENERFYCGNVGVLDILAGNIQKSIPEMRPLFEVIKAAEGRSDYDTALMAMLARQPAPGDAVIESPKTSPSSIPKSPFGIPEPEDPDPFGVIGLEMAGIEIREAGTHQRPTSSQFEFNPSPTSPVFARFSRQSIDTYLSRSNRGSCMSAKTVATAMTDAGTQTDVGSSPETSVSRANSDDGRDNTPEKLPTVVEPEEVDYTKIDTSAIEQFRRRSFEEPTMTAVVSAPRAKPEVVDQGVNTDKSEVDSNAPAADERDEDADDEEEEEEDEEEPIICEVATTAQPTRVAIRSPQITQVIQAKGAIVTIPKRIPPPLPPRSPARTSRASKSDFGGDVAALKSPLRGSFLSTDLPTETDYTQHPSDGAADNSSAEVFATPPSVIEPESAKELFETVEPEVHGHRNNSSLPAAEDITVEQRRSTDNSSQEPRTPSARELASSAEDSEREPRTPQIEKDFVGLESEKSDMGRVNGVSIVSHNSESNSVLVA